MISFAKATGKRAYRSRPNFEAVIGRVCEIVSQDKARLTSANVQGLECKTDGKLTFAKAKSEEVNSARLLELQC